MYKLLIVTTIPATVQAFLLPYIAHFRAQGWQVDAMAQGITDCTECTTACDRIWEVEWSRNPLDPRNFINAPRQIHQVLAQQNYDLVHVHTPVAAFVTRYAINRWQNQTKPKVIYTAHGFHFYRGGSPVKNTIFRTLEKLAGHWTDYLVVINRQDEQAAQHQIVPAAKIRYMPGIGVDTNYYSPQAVAQTDVMQVRQELGLTPENPLFLSIAEFIPRKRHRDLLQAFALLEHQQAHLALAGTGPLQEAMQSLASELGIAERVHFLGLRRDIPVLIRASVATLLVSAQEGLPRSVMESLSLEIPVIGTDIRGIQDLLESDLLVQLGDVTGITRAMNWVLIDPEAAQTLGKKGRDRMATYDLQQIIAMHENLYAEALR
ncbi:glycosyltransferase family 4 protein [Gloeocapsopsis dulcis]|uniref:Glycosyltransferase family 1 protein n=1 Tax=Gloeocapsopsis dulcis AAB1 = 1H9 TaxID=1433147 RepID=A0A6N8G1M9_9CHRO|nr:glycosyltransferase family 4 protein [Gloeocapsopsis dulcis]MUL38999.1 glycosyltransferase family 1 protein [Gloeocapsopsis dulcis AAB1 = 1H9]WNN90831.1 glycosyltransferase family 4 protein [Gloeocapsopsis dulcis]